MEVYEHEMYTVHEVAKDKGLRIAVRSISCERFGVVHQRSVSMRRSQCIGRSVSISGSLRMAR